MPTNTPTTTQMLRNTTCNLRTLFMCVFMMGACAASEAEVKRARDSGYQTDFAVVYSEALAAVAKRYPRSVEDAKTGLIQTAWHIVSVQKGSNSDTTPTSSSLASDQGQATGGIESVATTTASDRKRYFVRFKVHVIGGKPWRVRVRGEASEWSAGDVPLPLRGAEVPAWLKGRTSALQVDIYKRLKKYAVVIKKETKTVAPIRIARPDSFGDIPEVASNTIELVYLAVKSRDLVKLRANVASDVIWSSGSAGNLDVALAMWQADPAILDELVDALETGCSSGDDQNQVTCPGKITEPVSNYQVTFEKRGEVWKLSAFFALQ